MFLLRVLPIGGSDLIISAITRAKLDTVNKYLGFVFDWPGRWISFKVNFIHFVKECAAICFISIYSNRDLFLEYCISSYCHVEDMSKAFEVVLYLRQILLLLTIAR